MIAFAIPSDGKPTPLPPDNRPDVAIVYPRVRQNVKDLCGA
jgi:hypothetical protein